MLPRFADQLGLHVVEASDVDRPSPGTFFILQHKEEGVAAVYEHEA